jgi:hypothetical protein
MATAGELIEQLKEYDTTTPLLWQFYAAEHAAVDPKHFRAVSADLMNNQVFLEDLHQFISEWMELTQNKLNKEGN